MKSFHRHRKCVMRSTRSSLMLKATDEEAPFQAETDASKFALAGMLNQIGHPDVFFS